MILKSYYFKHHIKLEKFQPLFLNSDDEFNIGSLYFTVQRYNTGIAHSKGTRMSMEDSHLEIQNLGISYSYDSSLFAIFDGHGGDDCSKFVAQKLIINLKNIILQDNDLDQKQEFYHYIYQVFHESIQQTDLDYFEQKQDFGDKHLNCGSTGAIVLIFGDLIFCANIGDSRVILCRNGEAYNLSQDHKPSDKKEQRRIVEANGKVVMDMGAIGVSRSFGDFQYKKEEKGTDQITVEPDIRTDRINFMTDEFIVIACDGLFESQSNQHVVNFIKNKYSQYPNMEQDPQVVAQQLVENAVNLNIEKRKCSDNVSAIIINLSRMVNDQPNYQFDPIIEQIKESKIYTEQSLDEIFEDISKCKSQD